MYYLGEILRIFTLPEKKEIVIVKREVDPDHLDHFPEGTTIELQNRFSEKLALIIESAELATQMGKAYLAFVLKRRLDQNTAKAYEHVWSPVKLDQ